MKVVFVSLIFLFLFVSNSFSQNDTLKGVSQPSDTLTKMEAMMIKGENLFKILPVPIFAYTSETGLVMGLAKYNLIDMVKSDTVSDASSFSELATISTEGQYKFVFSSNILLKENKINLIGQVAFINFPYFFLGVGNSPSKEDVESITTQSIEFRNTFLYALDKKKTLYIGIDQEYKNFVQVKHEDSSFLVLNDYPGLEGGVASGLGLSILYNTRDNRYNPSKGMYVYAGMKVFDESIFSHYNYNAFTLDIRKFFNPWYKHVFAVQATTESAIGNTPFYSLALLGGESKMRGYYKGALRDQVLVDAQIEYRMPIWNIFGITGFLSAGRVAADYQSLDLAELRYAGGIGFRIMVDKKNKANLRFDLGYGQKGATTFSIGFTEAF